MATYKFRGYFVVPKFNKLSKSIVIKALMSQPLYTILIRPLQKK